MILKIFILIIILIKLYIFSFFYDKIKQSKIYKGVFYGNFILSTVAISDLIFCIILVLLQAFFQFKWFSRIEYFTNDAEAHYRFAFEFFKHSKLLCDGLPIFQLTKCIPETFLTGAYCNVGILFKSLSHFFDQYSFYKIFEVFDLCMWFLMGTSLYCLLSKRAKNFKQNFLSIIFGIIFVLGYPLLALISGFQYLSVGLNIIINIIIISEQRDSSKSNLELYICSFLLNFGLFFSYGYFVPVVYISLLIKEIIRMVHNYKEKNLRFESLAYILYTLIIPCIIGVFHFIVRPLILNLSNSAYLSATANDIYNRNYTFFIFIPFIIYFIYKTFKEKNFSTLSLLTISEILFILILFIGYKLGKVSEYYYYKSYYLMWILTIYITFTICIDCFKYLTMVNIVAFLYMVMILVSILLNKGFIIWDVYIESSSHIILKPAFIIDKDEIEKLKHINSFSDNYQKINYLGIAEDMSISAWKSSILNSTDYMVDSFGFLSTLDNWIQNEDHDILICFKTNKYYENQQLFLDNYGITTILNDIEYDNPNYTVLENSNDLLVLRKNFIK